MDLFEVTKWVHIVSAAVLFGTGMGTAFSMYATHLRGDVRAISVAAKNVVLADWLFTAPAGIVQPVSGAILIHLAGYSWFELWIVLSLVLYVVAAACWLPVVWLQIRVARLAADAVINAGELPDEYHRFMRYWFLLGWPAFTAMVVIIWLMVSRPTL